MSDLMNSNWGRELQSIIGNMNTKDVKEVMDQASKSYEELESNHNNRNKENYPLNLNDIIKLEVERIYYTHHTDNENIPKNGKIMIYLFQLKLTFQQILKSFVLH